ncbi:MAG: hypothetical protein AB8B74_01375 [Crocinitomicaceae bacterium]
MLLLFALAACVEMREQEFEKPPQLDADLVNYIEIDNRQDTMSAVQLSVLEKEEFVRRWNNAIPIGMCKYMPEYYIIVKLVNDSTKIYSANGDCIKGGNDLCFKFNSNEYFDLLWKNK